MKVLVFNVGSTTLKYACIDAASGQRVCGGLFERIGEADAGSEVADHLARDAQTVNLPTHEAAAKLALEQAGEYAFDAIAHRIVQGGDKFSAPTRVTGKTLTTLRTLDSLAPLHNPPARRVVESIATAFPHLPQTLVFDTAYFATLAPAAYRYAISTSVADPHGIRRYGFHGTSHEYVVQQALQFLGGEQTSKKIISLHLGGGASGTASIGGVAVDTSMGMTPLEGLVMATRCGDIDPAIVLYLIRQAGMTADEVDKLLNSRSGLLGLCGDRDMRIVLSRASSGDAAAELAIDIYVRKIVKTIGGFFAILGGLDALVFTAGVGEHSVEIRRQVTDAIAHLGLRISPETNQAAGESTADARVIDLSAAGAAARTLVVPTNEELAIAKKVAGLSMDHAS